MKIAIVGAGVSGMVAAHLLYPRHEIVVFEAGESAGGHANTIRVDTPEQTHNVDTGFMVFNDRNYPNFERLLRQFGEALLYSKSPRPSLTPKLMSERCQATPSWRSRRSKFG